MHHLRLDIHQRQSQYRQGLWNPQLEHLGSRRDLDNHYNSQDQQYTHPTDFLCHRRQSQLLHLHKRHLAAFQWWT